MKRLLRCVLSASLACLAGCASQAPMRYAESPATAPAPETVRDVEYMAAVEHVARRRGVQVRWVNPPLKPAIAVAAHTGD